MDRSFFTLYRRYLSYVLKYKREVTIGWIGAFLLLLANNASILIVGYLIDAIQRGENFEKYLVYIILTIASPLIIEMFTFFFRSRLFAYSISDMISDAYSKVLRLDYEFHTNKQSGKLISVILNAPDIALTFLWQVEWFLIEGLAALIIPIILIAFIDLKVALAVLVCLIITLPFIQFGLKFNIKRRTALKERDYERNTQLVDGISNFETVKIFGREVEEIKYMGHLLESSTSALHRYQNTFRIIDGVSRLSGILIFISASYLITRLFNNGDLTLGEMIVIISYLLSIMAKISQIFFTLRDVVKNLPIAKDLFDLIDHEVKVEETAHPKEIENPEGSIKFDNISFSYNDSKQVIKNLTIDIKSKQNIALVGPSGGGKSTLIKLLMRYYDVNAGKITIDKVDIKDLKQEDLRSLIALVPQEPVLFNKSILYNIGYALSTDIELVQRNKDKIIEACKKAQIHNFIDSLPEGYDTVVGERGIKLSGGQKQRIAIARVILKAPKIVVFDEATSMLDSESELAIQKAFKEMSKDKTVIIIAHRLSTIIHCENIFLIEEGQVKESGNHEQLLVQNGAYARLWSIQSGGFSK